MEKGNARGKAELPDSEDFTYIGIEEMPRSAENYSSNRDYAEAVKLWSKAAASGNAEAQRKLGDCYFHGDGITEDYWEACKWYMKAAEQGDTVAQSMVKCYFCLEKNKPRDHTILKMAAELGDTAAQCRLALFFREDKKYNPSLSYLDEYFKQDTNKPQ